MFSVVRRVAVAVFVLAACRSDSLPFSPRGGDLAVEGLTVAVEGTPAALRARLDAWMAQGPRNYLVEQQIFCFCADWPEFQPAVVEVRHGQVARAWNLRTGREFVPREGTLRSIEQLLAEAIAWAERGDPVSVQYYALSGYPARVTLGEPARDWGATYVLSNLRPR